LEVGRIFCVVVVGRELRGEGVRLHMRGDRLLVSSCAICSNSGSSCPVRVNFRSILERVSAVPWMCCSIGRLP